MLQELLKQQRTRATQNAATYRPDLAETLNSLGILYWDTNQFDDAEAAFKEAAAIRRELAAQDPGRRGRMRRGMAISIPV